MRKRGLKTVRGLAQACEIISIETTPARANSKIFKLRVVVRNSQGETIRFQAFVGSALAADMTRLERWVRHFVCGAIDYNE